jgi:hypothetical protein
VLLSGLPLASAVGLLQSAAWVVIGEKKEEADATTPSPAEAACKVFASLVGLPYPPKEGLAR